MQVFIIYSILLDTVVPLLCKIYFFPFSMSGLETGCQIHLRSEVVILFDFHLARAIEYGILDSLL